MGKRTKIGVGRYNEQSSLKNFSLVRLKQSFVSHFQAFVPKARIIKSGLFINFFSIKMTGTTPGHFKVPAGFPVTGKSKDCELLINHLSGYHSSPAMAASAWAYSKSLKATPL